MGRLKEIGEEIRKQHRKLKKHLALQGIRDTFLWLYLDELFHLATELEEMDKNSFVMFCPACGHEYPLSSGKYQCSECKSCWRVDIDHYAIEEMDCPHKTDAEGILIETDEKGEGNVGIKELRMDDSHKTDNERISKCCSAPAEIQSSDTREEITTCWFRCSGCGEPCDIQPISDDVNKTNGKQEPLTKED